jgi:hypothetical protein
MYYLINGTLFSKAKQPKFVGSADEHTLEHYKYSSNLGRKSSALPRTSCSKTTEGFCPCLLCDIGDIFGTNTRGDGCCATC